MSDYKSDSNIDFKGLWFSPSTNLDFGSGEGAPTPYIPSANFDFTGEWLQANANFDFGESETAATNIYPVGIGFPIPGFPTIRGNTVYVTPNGLAPAPFGNSEIRNTSQQVIASGFNASLYGNSKPYNYLTYIKVNSFDASAYGFVYLQGGMRFLEPSSISSSDFGKAKVFNTTANQSINPNGIAAPALPIPKVYPLTIYQKGFVATLFGSVQMQRSPMPIGSDQSSYGNATIWYHTRQIAPAAINSFDTGYPTVFDPTQNIHTQSVVETGVFGDIKIANKNILIYTQGIGAPAMPDYATVESNRRYLRAKGIDAPATPIVDVRNKTPSIFVQGIPPAAPATASIGYRIQTIQATGINSLASGTPTLNKTPEIKISGFNALGFGTQTIWHKNRTISVTGWQSQRFGDNTAWFKYRTAIPKSWLSELFSSPVIAHGIRTLEAKGFSAERLSNGSRISYGVQVVAPLSINDPFPTKHFVGRHQNITAIGFNAALFGTRVIPESQSIYPQGFINTFGLALVGLKLKYVQASGFITVGQQPADRWGSAAIYNLTQYVQQEYDANSGLAPPKQDGWTLIENRNKQLNISSFNAMRFGYNAISNGARLIEPIGITTPFSLSSMVAHSIRTLSPQGIEPPAMTEWGVVYNDGRSVSAKGINTEQLGIPSLTNNRRYYQWVGAFDASEFGTGMIAYRVRTIDVEFRYSIGPPQINLPRVDLHTQYIDCVGKDMLGMGPPSLSIHFNIIQPRWYKYDFAGEPKVHNVTPELLFYGHNSESFGLPAIRTQWRTLRLDGSNTQAFGRTRIADSKQSIQVRGWHSLTVSDKLTFTKTGVPPFGVQVISLDAYIDYGTGNVKNGFGIEPPRPINEDRATVHSNNITPASIVTTNPIGNPTVTANSIRVEPGYHELLFGENTRIYNSQQRIILEADTHKVNSEAVFGNARMSPHTVYAGVEAPQQAIENHQKVNRHVVDGALFGSYQTLKGVGTPKIESAIKSISNAGVQSEQGVVSRGLSVVLARVVVSPKGIASPILGVPSIPFTDQYVACDPFIFQDSFGLSNIKSYYYGVQEIVTIGKDCLQIPQKHTVILKNRYIKPTGFLATTMGTRRQNDSPFMWQGLRVGEHVPFIQNGEDMLVMGDASISLRVRQIEVSGFDALASGYDPNNFSKKMTVKRKEVLPETKRITLNGIPSSNFGVTNLKYGQQFIRPDGNSNQFRKGGYHA